MWPCSQVRHLDRTVLFLRGSFKVFVDRSQDASVSPVPLVFPSLKHKMTSARINAELFYSVLIKFYVFFLTLIRG